MSKYRRVPLDEIVVDERYQRPLEEGRVERIATNFDEAQLGVLEVSRRNGKCAVFDGQHRYRALLKLGVKDAPCLVHDDMTPSEEADMFVRLQRDRKPVHPVDRFRAQLFAGDSRAIDITASVKAAGYDIGHVGPEAGPSSTIRAVVAVERLYSRGGGEAIGAALGFITDHWAGDPRCTDGHLIEGVYEFIALYSDRLGVEEHDRLRSTPPVDILRRAAGRQAGLGGNPGSKRHLVAAELHATAGLNGRPRKPR
jgi:hypothetical protein